MTAVVREQGKIRVEHAGGLADLAAHAEKWNALALRSRQKLPCLSYAWVATYFEHRLRADQSAACLFAYEDDDLLGVLPLVMTPHRLWGRRRPRLRMPFDWHTISVDFLVEPSREDEIIPLLISALDHVHPGWFCLELMRLPDSSPTLKVTGMAIPGLRVIHQFDGKGSYVDLEGGYDNFRKSLNSKFVKRLKYLNRKLSEDHEVTEEFLVEPDGLSEGIDDFIELEGSGRKKEGGAIRLDSSLVAFYKKLAERLGGQGWLELHFLKADGQILAGHFAPILGDVLMIMKISYNEDFGRYSPGSLLIERVTRHAFDIGGIKEINFLTDLPWNRKWRMKKRDYYNVLIFPRRPLSIVLGAWPARAVQILKSIPLCGTICRRIKNLLRKGG